MEETQRTVFAVRVRCWCTVHTGRNLRFVWSKTCTYYGVGEVNRRIQWRENVVRKVWCQQGQRVVQPAARQGWNLRPARAQSQAEGGGGREKRNTSGRKRARQTVHRGERQRNMQPRGIVHTEKSGKWRNIDEVYRWSVWGGGWKNV